MVLVALNPSDKAGRVAVVASGEETVDVSTDPVLSEISELSDLLETATAHVRASLYRKIRAARANGYSVPDLALAAKKTPPRIYQILSDSTREESDDRGTPRDPAV